MSEKKITLEKFPLKFFNRKEIIMMNNLRKKTVNHLISNCAKQFFSGFLTEKDIKQVEELTGEKVECSTESGEYFYRIKA